MSNFITNSTERTLKARMETLIKHSSELRFLVSFFYFSGLEELVHGLKANEQAVLKILVGLNIDRHNKRIIELDDYATIYSETTVATRFFEDVQQALSHTEYDTQSFYRHAHFFIEMIKSGRLIIRKTHHPNHAKLYLFQLFESQIVSNLLITGSSNLTRAGLSTQHEFNVELSDYGYPEAYSYFEELWSEAVEITEDVVRKNELFRTLEQRTPMREVTPFVAYCLMLKSYLDSFEHQQIHATVVEQLKKAGYRKYRYQIDAIEQALAIIEKQRGVIIADVVGLGKTVIACAIAKQLGKRGLILCPPGIIGDENAKSGWKQYTDQFRLDDWEVRSQGKLEETLEWLTSGERDIEVVIIDEAHRFRNEDTETYELVRNICRNRIVILLTATPFNNKPNDLLALLKLFIAPKQSPITLERDLSAKFAHYNNSLKQLHLIKKYYQAPEREKRERAEKACFRLFKTRKIDIGVVNERIKHYATEIRRVIEPITIRRNRLDLQRNPHYQSEVTDLPKVADPIEWFFELRADQLNFYTEVIEHYFADPDVGGSFRGAIYRPYGYKTGEAGSSDEAEEDADDSLDSREQNRVRLQQRNLFDFMRRLLVKRFESSFGAFRQSIENFTRVTERCLAFVEKTGQYILDRALIDKIYTEDADEIAKHLQEYVKNLQENPTPNPTRDDIYTLSEFHNADAFIADMKRDLQLFKDIGQRLQDLALIENDPKTACLISNLKRILDPAATPPSEPKRKVIIFSEYVDTIKYLSPHLLEAFGNRVLVVHGGGLTQGLVDDIECNFNASCPQEKQRDEYDILLASDKMSEGFNLNRAGVVVNYDIPWNPIRVIQRLGRINRISHTLFPELWIINFFPTEQGAGQVRSREIAEQKMFLIHTILGEDAKIFDAKETPTPSDLYKQIVSNPESNQEMSFYTKSLLEYEEIKRAHPELINSLDDFPPRVKVAKRADENRLTVLFKKSYLHIATVATDSEKLQPQITAVEEGIERARCSFDTPSLDWNTDRFWRAYEKITALHRAALLDSNTQQTNDQSVEQEAINTLNALIRRDDPQLRSQQPYLDELLDDVQHYGTLSHFTLRRIGKLALDDAQKTADDLGGMKRGIPLGYLERVKEQGSDHSPEIIIAIENKRDE